MALFSDLFLDESFDNEAVAAPVDYLKDVPLIKFDENMSLVECGAKGMVVAEAGWLDLCNHVSNLYEGVEEEFIDEGVDQFKNKVKRAGGKIKEFFKSLPDKLRKIAQIIFSTVNKFLTAIQSLIKQDNNLVNTSVDTFKAGFDRYVSNHEEKTINVKGFRFKNAPQPSQFSSAIKAGTAQINEIATMVSNLADMKDSLLKKQGGADTMNNRSKVVIDNVRKALIGVPDTGAATDRSFKTDAKKYYSNPADKDGTIKFTKNDIQGAITIVKGGFREGQKAARQVYKDAKESINKQIEMCDKLASKFESFENEKNAKESDKTRYSDLANAVHACGKTMSGVSGVLSQFTGVYCQCLRDHYQSHKSFLTTCAGYAKGGKAGEKLYKESTNVGASMFGLDLI